MSSTVQASDGMMIPLSSVFQTYAYDGDDNLETITVDYAGRTYVQTYTYADGVETSRSNWVYTP